MGEAAAVRLQPIRQPAASNDTGGWRARAQAEAHGYHTPPSRVVGGRKRTATAVASDALWRTDAPRVAPGLVQSRTLADRGPHPGQPPHLRVHTRQVGRCRHDRVLDIPPRGQAAERRHFDRARRNRGRKDPDARPRGTPACPRGAWPARRSGGARRVVMRAPAIARCADGGTLPPGGVDL